MAPEVVEYVPAEQLMHSVTTVAPEVDEYVPVVQCVQLLLALAPVPL